MSHLPGIEKPLTKLPSESGTSIVASGPTDAGQPFLWRLVGRVKDLLVEHWFILGLGVAIGIAAAVPDLGRREGWIRSEYSVKYPAVAIIFLLSGLGLKTKALAQAFASVRLHGLIQGISLGIIPAVGFGISKLLRLSSMDDLLLDGLVICMSMPTTVSTNVVYTTSCDGNEALAVVNAVAGNIVGIFLTPALLMLYLGRSGQAPVEDVFFDLAVTVIAPLIVGQILLYFFPNQVKKLSQIVPFAKVSSVMILMLVWITFSTTFADKNLSLSAATVVIVIVVDVGLLLAFFSLSFVLATAPGLRRLWNANRADVVAVFWVAPMKTVALGIPLITVLYAKTTSVGLLSTPLLVYHAAQILSGSLLIPYLKKWRHAEDVYVTAPTTPPSIVLPVPAGSGTGLQLASSRDRNSSTSQPVHPSVGQV